MAFCPGTSLHTPPPSLTTGSNTVNPGRDRYIRNSISSFHYWRFDDCGRTARSLFPKTLHPISGPSSRLPSTPPDP
ncbi:hypothetical protein E2C01_087342 [Portunus trituberculatus]|uniref:Uncharacterized protein n=1 Tax=Portunus trituberculatus TaxID=210409 RepID=A0A5B7JD30_PORTR|nr:hypothetical protein [Portunus trituberculatus]